MDLLLANPLSRSQIVVKKTVAMVVHAVLFAITTIIGCWIGILIGGQDEMSISGIAAASVLLALFGLLFGGVALLTGAVTGKRKLATWTTTGVALVTWFMFSFLSISATTEPLTRFSPWEWYLGGDPVLQGMDWTGAALLFGTFLVLVVLSVPAFRRRDLGG